MKLHYTIRSIQQYIVVACCLLAAYANAQDKPIKIGDEVSVDVSTSHPYNALGNQQVVFQKEFYREEASYIKLHFKNFDLASGDYVELSSPGSTTTPVIYKEKGKEIDGGITQISDFWSQAILAEKVILKLHSNSFSSNYGFDIDIVAYGYPQALIEQTVFESICGNDDKEDVECYNGTEMYEKAKSVCKLILNGSSLCTGWLLGDEGHVMTNNHCIGSAAVARNTDFIFNYQRSSCGGSNAPSNTVAQTSTFLCTDDNLDYTLVKLPVNPTNQYGFLSLRSTRPQVGERIYIPQHPGGRRKALAVNDDQSSDGLARVRSNGQRVGYQADTEGGSSGSPVLSFDDNLVVALHNTGGCNNGGNRCDLIIADMGSCMPNNGVDNPGITAKMSVSTTKSCDGIITFSNVSSSSTNQNWDFGDGNKSILKNPTHTYQLPGTYTVKLMITNDKGKTAETSQTVNVLQLDPPSVLGAFTCGNGSADLVASGNGGVYNWYDAETGGNLLTTGKTYTTPSLSSNTTFYVEEVEDISVQKVGPADNSFAGGGNHTSEGFGLLFDATKPFTLKTVKVYAEGAGVREIAVTAGVDGDVVASKSVNLANGENRVELDFNIPAGTNHFIRVLGSNVNLYRNNENISYPYSINGLVSIKASNASTPGDFYYYFYDWEVEEKKCASARGAVEVEVREEIALPNVEDESICSGESAVLNATGSGGQLSWYETAEGGIAIATGNELVTTSLLEDETYYVSETALSAEKKVGPENNTLAPGGIHESQGFGLLFDVLAPLTIKSVKMYASGAGMREVAITDGVEGDVLMSKEVSMVDGEQRVDLDFSVPVGSDYFMRIINTDVNLYRNNEEIGYPFSVENAIVIKSSNASDPDKFYYYFYDWVIQESGCSSKRAAATVEVDEVPVPEVDVSGNVLEAPAGYTYQWYQGSEPINGATSQSYTPAENGNYRVEITNGNGCSKFSESVSIVISSIGEVIYSSRISLYPNPVSETLSLEVSSTNNKMAKLIIYNSVGQPVLEDQVVLSENLSKTINVSHLAEGVYHLTLTNDQINLAEQFNVQ